MTPESIARAVGNPGLAEELIASIAVGLADSPMSTDRDPLSRLDSAIRAVMLDLDTHKKNGLLKALISADWDSTDTDVVDCLNFVKSQIVNKFKGYLGEFLAMRLCTELAREWKRDGRLPPSAQIVWGTDIRQRERKDGAWLQGADGLLVVVEQRANAPSLVIFGVIEVKAYRGGTASQVDSHVARLRYGLKIGECEWPADRLFVGKWDRGRSLCSKTRVTAMTRPAILRLRVKPCAPKRLSKPEWRGDSFSAPLLCTSDFLARAAYNMSIWFIEQLGARAFKTTPSPWPGMTAEAAGVNAVKQALYYILLRTQLPPRAQGIAAKLYNVYGFGYSDATGHRDMLWPGNDGQPKSGDAPKAPLSAEPPSSSTMKELVDGAWTHYRRGRLAEAEQWARAANRLNAAEAAAKRVRWLLGMIRFYRADYSTACKLLPEPGAKPSPDTGVWVREILTLARANARAGQFERARALLDRAERDGSRWDHVSVAVSTIQGWMAHTSGDAARADDAVTAASTAIAGLRQQAEARDRARLGDPLFHDPGAIQIAIVDTAALLVALNRRKEALDLLARIKGLFGAVREWVAADPAFDPLRKDTLTRQGFTSWVQARREEDRGEQDVTTERSA